MIAHVITESEPFGGAQRATLLTLRGLIRDGFLPELICGGGGPLIREAKASGVTVHVIPDLVRLPDPIRDLRTFLTLYRLFRSRRYEVVHTHSTKAGLLGRVAARAARVPAVVHTFEGFPFPIDGGMRSRLFVAMERWLGPATDCAICVAEAIRKEVSCWRLRGCPRVVTIYSGIDFSSCAPSRKADVVKGALGLSDAWPIVGSVGNLRAAKAQHTLIESMAILRKTYPRIRLLIAGEGELRPYLETRISDLDLEANVTLLGERNDVADLLGIFDLYAMCSLWEGLPRALIEAMYCGLPVVTTPVYGASELVFDEDTGLTIPQRDPGALAAALGRLIREPDLARRLGANASARVKERMSSERMIAATETLYAELLASKRGPAQQIEGSR